MSHAGFFNGIGDSIGRGEGIAAVHLVIAAEDPVHRRLDALFICPEQDDQKLLAAVARQ